MVGNSGCTGDSDTRQACRRIVRRLSEKYGWTLLSESDLVARVLASAQPEAQPADLERLARYHYTAALYEACRQTRDPHRREQAYQELFRYLYRAAHNRWPELAKDATQRALLLVHEQIECCRQPGAFLAFALHKLRHAFQQEQQARGCDRPEEPLDDESFEQEQTAYRQRLSQKREERLMEAIERLPDVRQRQVITLKYLQGLSDEGIGVCLGITANHVRVLRHRGLARLRRDGQLKSDIEDVDGEIG